MTRNGRTNLSVKNRITLLQHKIIEWTKNRNLYEAEGGFVWRYNSGALEIRINIFIRK